MTIYMPMTDNNKLTNIYKSYGITAFKSRTVSPSIAIEPASIEGIPDWIQPSWVWGDTEVRSLSVGKGYRGTFKGQGSLASSMFKAAGLADLGVDNLKSLVNLGGEVLNFTVAAEILTKATAAPILASNPSLPDLVTGADLFFAIAIWLQKKRGGQDIEKVLVLNPIYYLSEEEELQIKTKVEERAAKHYAKKASAVAPAAAPVEAPLALPSETAAAAPVTQSTVKTTSAATTKSSLPASTGPMLEVTPEEGAEPAAASTVTALPWNYIAAGLGLLLVLMVFKE